MTGQIVEITQPGHWLSKSRGFLKVSEKGEKVGQVPLDDIAAVIVSTPGCSVSTVLIDQLCQRNVPLVICGENYLPSSFTLPLQGYGRQFRVMRAQTALSEPRRKRLWQKIVRAKIKNQAEALDQIGQNPKPLLRLTGKVRSGDPDNCEAQAARLYWQNLFGADFRRNRDMPGINAALNYTYAIVRACVARGASGAGLHPSFSLHHKNPQNPFNLVDDLMEPFRPMADYAVRRCFEASQVEMCPETKHKLAAITTLMIPLAGDSPPLSLATTKMCRSFAAYYLGEKDDVLLPTFPSPLEMLAL